MKRLLLLLLLALHHLPAAAQTYFNNRYTFSPAYSAATNVLATPGGYWVNGGCAHPQNPNAWALFLQFIDSSGTVQGPLRMWGRPTESLYSGGVGNALLRTRDGGMALAGSGLDGTVQWGMLWRFSAGGDTLWSRRYDNGYSLLLYNGCRTRDGGYALVGSLLTAPHTDLLAVLVRTDSLGQELWRQTYRQNARNKAHYVLETPDGGFLLTGFCGPVPGIDPYPGQGLVIKVAADGQQQWVQTFGDRYLDAAGPALVTAAGGYVVSGCWSVPTPLSIDDSQVALLWYDSSGTLLQRRLYGPARYATTTLALEAEPTGGYLLAGQRLDSTTSSFSGMVGFALRVCADGDSVWYRTYRQLTGFSSDNYIRDVKLTADGGFVATGFLFPRAPDTGVQGVWLFKADQYGYLQPGGAPPTRQCLPVGVVPEADEERLEIWPNPSADGRFVVRQVRLGATSLTVTDALGRVVWRGASAGSAETVVDLSASAAGVYVLRVQASDGRMLTRKLVR